MKVLIGLLLSILFASGVGISPHQSFCERHPDNPKCIIPSPSPTPSPVITPSPTPVVTPSPTPIPTPSPTAIPTPSPTPIPSPSPTPPVQTIGILLSPSEIAALPKSGTAYDAVLAAANSTWPVADLMNQDSHHGLYVLAAALTGQNTKARNGIAAALPTFNSGTTNSVLSLGRQLPAYIIAADIINLKTLDPALDSTLRTDLSNWRDQTVGTHGRWFKISFTYSDSSNNWGTHAGAAVVTIDRYLGRSLSADYDIFKEFIGTKTIVSPHFPKPSIAQSSWLVNPSGSWVPVQQATGDPRDGAITEDAWRSGAYPTLSNTYVMDSAQAIALQAEVLTRAGFPAWSQVSRYTGFLTRSNWSSIWTTSGGRGGRSLAFMYNKRLGLNISTANIGDRQAWSLAWMDWIYK